MFTYGYASGAPVPPGGSRVTIHLEEESGGTRLHLCHEFAEESGRDEHVQGWRFQLSIFANVVANEVHAGATSLVDAWFDTWAEPDHGKRAASLARIAAPEIRFRDRFSLLDGIPDVTAHIAASLRFMPGVRLQRRGDIRHCQGTVLADWAAVGNEGQLRGTGTNIFLLGADGRIQSVTGFWNPS